MTLTALKGIKSTAASAGDEMTVMELPCLAMQRQEDTKVFIEM